MFGDVIGNDLLVAKSADASSVYGPVTGAYGPAKVIDNDLENIFASLPPGEIDPWLQIELEYVAAINTVIIYNRRHCCGDRMKNVALRVGLTKFTKGMELDNNEICATYEGPGSDGEEIIINCSSTMIGQYVSVHLMLDTPGILNFSEIMIYGHECK